ncbi:MULTISPECIES: MocR-like pyridoxine biosynthesis transcription factor PdxR [unclassified Janthinobacterium]|uniref:MocR-like pyridoxine biosynthesis transcription factor PdxR n=1 Tax=unclassified Janthinobacterium TaxID=2610881 RepID=UPI000346AC57|nr:MULTISPECIES: PLP-dependent aminotransferase family protein [unclassified Janthinobacterium]MEC5161608.1 GntR family transcriptional regulator/MocR family aminotransferase [Janthinobacterium sp. CG_S6]
MSPAADLLSATLAQPEFHPRLPQQRRLYEAAKTAIHQNMLGAGTRLPSSRDLARDLGIARNTVIAAFEQLAAEGYVTTALGSGTYVADLQELSASMHRGAGASALSEAAFAARAAAPLSRRGEEITAFAAGARFEIQPFAPGDADFSSFPFKLWQRLQNRVWREARADLLDYGQSGGYLPLRQAITEYLRISRSVKVSVEQVMITAGTQQSLDLCAQLLADVGGTAWVEDPCYWGARRVFQARDLLLHPITVDANGMALDESDLATEPRLIYVTPSHQYPTGAVMSLARRRELLDVAVRKNAWILEDDYDSEFRYTGRPLAALQGLDTDNRVVYMGTFSKVLYPGIKVGYLVVPPALIAPFKSALYDLQRPGQLMVQAALADFIALGHFTTHVRKIRQIYGARREMLRRTLVAQLGPQLSQSVTISSEESGLHLVVELPDWADDVALSALAAESGILVKALSTYYLAPPVRRGLLVGYAYVTPEKITYYGKLLAAVIQSGVRR